MILGLLSLATVVGIVHCGQLSVLTSPSHVGFRTTNDVLPESHVTNIIQSVFGLESEYDWNGMLAGGFFDRPKAVVLLTVGGVRGELLNVTSQHSYDTDEDSPEPLSLQQVVRDLDDFSTDGRPALCLNLLVDKRHRVQLESGGMLPPVAGLQLPVSTPRLYVELNAITKTMATLSASFPTLQSDTPDLFHFHIAGLERVADRHGPHSPQMIRAVTSVSDVITQTRHVFEQLYENNLVVLMLTQSSSRNMGYPQPVARRQLLQTTESTVDFLVDLNLAPEFTWMYPVMFNISLWFMVTFILTIFGVGWCIWFTDPGRDGVIYRLTTTHIKQE